jgi:hypothetical protein
LLILKYYNDLNSIVLSINLISKISQIEKSIRFRNYLLFQSEDILHEQNENFEYSPIVEQMKNTLKISKPNDIY